LIETGKNIMTVSADDYCARLIQCCAH